MSQKICGDKSEQAEILNGTRKKKRGPYRKYNLFGSTAKIPARTKSRWRLKSRVQQLNKTYSPVKILHLSTDYDNSIGNLRNCIDQETQSKQDSNQVLLLDEETLDQLIRVESEQDHDSIDVNIDVDTILVLESLTQNPTVSPIPKDIPKKHSINNLLVMVIKWRRNTTYTVAQDILKLVNISSGTSNSNSSKYYWKKILDRYSQNVSTYYICEQCNNYLGPEKDCPTECGECHKKIDPKADKGSFLHLPLANQLREIFGTTDAHHLYSVNREKMNKYAIEDIYDGKLYKKHILNDTMISINFSVDGVPMFDSSNTSVYPVLCTINELNPYDRRNYVLLSNVWFGVGKPKNMNSYLKPFVEEAKTLLEKGFTYNYQGQSYTKTVVTLMGICNSVARPLVRCSTQFNGKYGCGLCRHPGKSVEKGRGHTRVYPIVDGNPFGEGLRTHKDTLVHAEAKTKEDRKGIKGVSVLCEIPDYDMIANLDVDWMHCVGLGVTRQFAGIWFDSVNSQEKFYFGDKIDEFDHYLTSFSPTSEISRTPRPLSDRDHMKAHEWIIFLVVYSLPIIKMCVPARYVEHWALLVDEISILVKPSIMKSELKYAEQCLRDFVAGVESLYGEKYVSFNVHLLLHLVISDENWGPLYTHIAFIYEDFNQTIQAYVKSPNGVEIQICDAFRLKCAIDRLAILCSGDLNYQQKKYLDTLLNRKSKPDPKVSISNCGVLGRLAILKKLPVDQHVALRCLFVQIDSATKIFSFVGCIINKQVITSQNYNREKKRVNYMVLLKNGLIFEIRNFIALERNNLRSTYLIGYYYALKKKSLIKNRKLENFLVIEEKIDTLAAVATDMVEKKVILLEMPKLNSCVAYVHGFDLELLT